MSNIIYPIVIANNTKIKYKLTGNICIRPLEDDEKYQFFGENEIGYDFINGSISEIKNKIQIKSGRHVHGSWIDCDNPNFRHLMAASHCLEYKSVTVSHYWTNVIVNIAFKLVELTSTCAFVWINSDLHSSGIDDNDDKDISLNSLDGPFGYLTLDRKNAYQIKYILSKIDLKDERFFLMASMYLDALRIGNGRIRTRFLNLSTILEMLYAPDGNKGEITYKISMRAAKILKSNSNNSEDAYQLSKEFKKIYITRSGLIHSGHSKYLTDTYFYKLAEIIRISLNIYLKDKNIFTEENLDKFLLG